MRTYIAVFVALAGLAIGARAQVEESVRTTVFSVNVFDTIWGDRGWFANNVVDELTGEVTRNVMYNSTSDSIHVFIRLSADGECEKLHFDAASYSRFDGKVTLKLEEGTFWHSDQTEVAGSFPEAKFDLSPATLFEAMGNSERIVVRVKGAIGREPWSVSDVFEIPLGEPFLVAIKNALEVATN